MEFRRLTLDDLDSYFANRLRGLQNSPHAFLTTFAEEKTRGNAHFVNTLSQSGDDRVIFGAINDQGIVVGTIGVFKEDRERTSHKCTIWGMHVDEDQRNKGIGGRLLDLAVKHAREKMNAAGIYLSVESGNKSARNLYESRGFQCWGTEPKAMRLSDTFCDEDHMALIFER